MQDVWVAGVDGCKGGWVAVFRSARTAARAEAGLFRSFAEILEVPRNPRVVAVDMPIGLPDNIGRGGRAPEAALRRQLGERQSSVFAVPSRQAVYAPDYPTACIIASATSEPRRKVSKQAFQLFPKIREIDALLRDSTGHAVRVFECHPEGSFRIMGGTPVQTPKKVKSRVHEPGLAERRSLLVTAGYPPEFLAMPLPAGAGRDDLLDACAAAWTAARIALAQAISWPAEPAKDAYGLPMVIWT